MATQALPVEYIPMSLSNLKEGDVYDDVTFYLQEKSHGKTISGLMQSLERRPSDESPYTALMPSEHWGFARVLCQSFGRLNEVALGGSTWDVFGLAELGSVLRSSTRVIGTSSKRGLAFFDALTETFDADSGRLLMRCRDRLILTHDCVKPFFFEPKPVRPSLPEKLLYENRHTVYHRYPWDPSIWENNIHVDEYAQLCGFAGALPEFVTYMDWVYHAAIQSNWPMDRPFTMKLQKILPMYLGESMRIVSWTDGDSMQVRFLKGDEERVVAQVVPLRVTQDVASGAPLAVPIGA